MFYFIFLFTVIYTITNKHPYTQILLFNILFNYANKINKIK